MGAEISKVFVSVDDIPQTFGGFMQLIFLAAVYGYILCYSSNMIKDGSELLLLVPALAGIVGSIVLPVLGAVPDGAIVIFSGLGPDAQSQISVGVGALAGSTIMLLTVPWVLSIIAGRVNMVDGVAQYRKPKSWTVSDGTWSKVMPAGAFKGTGVFCGPSIRKSAFVMIFTLIPYLVIQIPAAIKRCALQSQDDPTTCESPPIAALVGGILAALLFVFYLIFQARMANEDPVKESKIDELRRNAVRKQLISIRGLFPDKFVDHEGTVPLVSTNKRFQQCIRPFFRQFDIDGSGSIDKDEFSMLLTSLGEKPAKEQLNDLMKSVDTDGNGEISFEEFAQCVASIIEDPDYLAKVVAEAARPVGELQPSRSGSGVAAGEKTSLINNEEGNAEGDDEELDEEEEEVEIPEDLAHLSPEDQQKRILRRAFLLMGVGVSIVLLFSDPMCDVLSALGNHSNIKPFYIAFVLAPLASNASELIAAYSYALKKTEKTITISFASLIGAACMNNTFCLSLFLFLVYAKNLMWVFSAETISIIVVELIMFVFAIKRVHHWWYAIIVGALFPLSIVLVIGLEAAGLD